MCRIACFFFVLTSLHTSFAAKETNAQHMCAEAIDLAKIFLCTQFRLIFNTIYRTMTHMIMARRYINLKKMGCICNIKQTHHNPAVWNYMVLFYFNHTNIQRIYITSTKSKTLVINFILIFFSAILSFKTKKSVCVNALPQSSICFYFVSAVHDSMKNEFKKNIFFLSLVLSLCSFTTISVSTRAL